MGVARLIGQRKLKQSGNLDNVFDALANRHRRQIIYSLSLQPRSVSQLAAQQQLSLPAIHKHIRVLESAGVLQRKKHGRTTFLALYAPALADMQQWLMQYQPQWSSGAESLENYVARIEKDEQRTSN